MNHVVLLCAAIDILWIMIQDSNTPRKICLQEAQDENCFRMKKRIAKTTPKKGIQRSFAIHQIQNQVKNWKKSCKQKCCEKNAQLKLIIHKFC